MITLSVLLLSTTLVSKPQTGDALKASQQYATQCAGGKDTATCRTLRAQTESALLESLQWIESTGDGQPLDRDVLRIAAGAQNERLKKFALEHIQRQGQLSSADEAPIIAALNDPASGVREIAFQLAGQLHDEKYVRWEQRRQTHSHDEATAELEAVSPDDLPDAKALGGAATYPGANYLYFASDAHKTFWFNTPDSEDKVIASLSKGGKKVMTADQLQQQSKAASMAFQQQAQANPMAMAQAMQQAMAQGKDPSSVIADMQKGQTATMAGMQATNEMKDVQGLSNVKYVVVEETKSPTGGASTASKVVAVGQDAVLGGTSIVYFAQPKDQSAAIQAAMSGKGSSQQDVEQQMRINQLRSEPDVVDDGSATGTQGD